MSAILAITLLTLTATASAARPEERREGVPVDGEQQATSALDGTWTARYAGRKGQQPDPSRIHLQFHRDHSNMGQTWPAASLPGLTLDRDANDIRVELRREAGTIVLTGNVRRGRGFGIFDFTPNADFARQIGAAVGRKALTPERLFALAVHDVSRAYIQELEALGYKNLDLDDLLGMRIHGVTPEFIKRLRALGFTTLSHDDLVSARIHGVSPEFLDEIKKYGYSGLDFDDLVSFRIHGVTPDFIEEMAAAGYKDLSADRLVEFRIHGVDAEFVKDLKERGYSGLSSRELVEARIHGRRWMKRKGY